MLSPLVRCQGETSMGSAWELKQLKHPLVMPIHGGSMVAGDEPPMKVRGQREGVAPNPFSDKKLNLVQPNTNYLYGGNSDLWPGEKEALNCLFVRLGMLSPVSQISGHGDSNDLTGCSC